MQEHLSHIPLNLNTKLSSLPVQIFTLKRRGENSDILVLEKLLSNSQQMNKDVT